MIEIYQKYRGSGMILICFLAALVYLLITEKKKPNRILFVYTPMIVLLLYFNPLFYQIFGSLAEETIYFRIFWLLPITTVIGYTIIRICKVLQGRKKIGFAVSAILVIMISGKLVYTSPLFSKAENMYHVPWEVAQICDAIEVEGREVMAAFPEEMLLYVRQYSPVVCMPFGRDAVMGVYNELHMTMEQDDVDVERLAFLAKEYGCHYVILSEDKQFIGNMTDYDYIVFDQVGKYIIYKDTSMNFNLY